MMMKNCYSPEKKKKQKREKLNYLFKLDTKLIFNYGKEISLNEINTNIAIFSNC